VTRKITRAMARIALGLQECLYLGNLSACVTGDTPRTMSRCSGLMLQQDKPEDFVIATGVQYSVRQFVERAATRLGVTLEFSGEGMAEVGTVVKVDGTRRSVPTRRCRDQGRTRATSARPKSSRCWAMPARQSRSSAGRRASALRIWCAKWWMPTTRRRNATAW
jgi:GDP-D-mannose dehydratase